MKKSHEFNNDIIKIHSNICLQGTNNTLFIMTTLAPIEDKKFVFPDKLKEALNIPNEINNWYEMKKIFGVYERLYHVLIISLCSDIEFMLKDLMKELLPEKKFNFGFFQRFREVIKTLEDLGYRFDSIQNELKTVEKCFQIRHIAIHNMGYVDEKFKNNVETKYNVDEHFFVDQEVYKEAFNSYWKFLEKLDEQIYVHEIK
jgi:hypothetical protein